MNEIYFQEGTFESDPVQLSEFGHIPRIGEYVFLHNCCGRVTDVRYNYIHKFVIIKLDSQA